MANPVVSVIVPAYNVERYIEQCVDSICAQTLREIEIICVNDGSTDSTLDILRRYEALDSRVRVIDKQNTGYGNSVNTGIDQARGEWISIVESDDFLDENMLSDLVMNAKLEDGGTADIVKSSFWLYYDATEESPECVKAPNLAKSMKGRRYEFDVLEDPEVIRHHPSIWSAIYRRSFLNDYAIRMIEPKGAGWTDNPWLYDTMLLAKRIVWIPTAYYYYRQSRESSTNIADYHLVFDRLRDIRGIYEKLEVRDPGLLAALYARSITYVVFSILKRGGFREDDPELQSLIKETFATFDEEILFDSANGIRAAHLDYYQDFTGKLLDELKPCLPEKNPSFSYVICMKDDRERLWYTVKSLTKQVNASFEAILVNCDSHDRSAAIAKSIAEKDQRFRVVSDPSGSVGAGFNRGLAEAKGKYVSFLRPGALLIRTVFLERLATAVRSFGREVPDVIVTDQEFPEFKSTRFEEELSERHVDCNECAELVIAGTKPGFYGKFLERTFAQSGVVAFNDAGDEDGLAFWTEVVLHAQKVALLSAFETRITKRQRLLESKLDGKDDAAVQYAQGRYKAIASVAERDGSERAWRVARTSIVHAMVDDMRHFSAGPEGLRFFTAAKAVFEGEFGLSGQSASYYCNYEDYRTLDLVFRMSYEDYLAERAKQDSNRVELDGNRLSDHVNRYNGLEKKYEKLKDTAKYGPGAKVVKALRKVNPKKAKK